MDRATDLLAEDLIDEPVLLDPALSGESRGRDGRPEMIPAAGVVLDLGPGSGDGRFDSSLDFLGAGHLCRKGRTLAAILSKAMISITDRGAQKVQEFLDSQSGDVSMAGLRVGVRGGGCTGFQYQLAFDEQRANDSVFESHGLKLLVDNESLDFVRGSTIDYEESLQGAGFKVNNPNVVAACGCGSSFRVAEEEHVSAV